MTPEQRKLAKAVVQLGGEAFRAEKLSNQLGLSEADKHRVTTEKNDLLCEACDALLDAFDADNGEKAA